MEVYPREIVALRGANGAGKSTTLMTIVGLVRAAVGKVIFDGTEIHKLRPEEIVKRGVSLVPEGRRLFAHLSVLDNLRLGAATRRDRAGIEADTEEQFDLFPVLGKRRKQLAGTLSGGEQQMLAVSRSLMRRPKMILLDEPSLGLAPLLVARIFELIAQLPARGVTVLLVEQNARMALEIAERGYVLATGELQESGRSEDLQESTDLEDIYFGTTT
jgi:branched-chain amino acid transport system ATP-binding protein